MITPPEGDIYVSGYVATDDEEGRRGFWMQTWSGRKYWPLDPRPEDVVIEDVANMLAGIARYNAATIGPNIYTVAEHSYWVSVVVPAEHAFYGLMHDAAEAYCGDMIRPLRKVMPEFNKIIELNEIAVCDRFGMDHEVPEEVVEADCRIVSDERVGLMAHMDVPDELWGNKWKGYGLAFTPWGRERAATMFLGRFYQLLGRE